VSLWSALTGKKKTPQQMLAAGNYKEALKALLAEEKSKRDDPLILHQIGDTYLKLDQPRKAKEYFIRVGDFYGERGFFNKSVAVFKKALNITPGDKAILEKLVAFNDKVPKFMLNDQFFRDAMGQAPPKSASPALPIGGDAHEPAPADPDEGLELASGDEAFSLEQGYAHGEEPPVDPIAAPPAEAPPPAEPPVDPIAAPPAEAEAPPPSEASPIEAEPDAPPLIEPGAALTDIDDDLSGLEDIDPETFSEISEDITAEFEKAALDAHGPKVLEKRREEAEKPAGKRGPTVFKSRASEAPANADEGLGEFSSFDDALDAIFASEPASPAAREIREQSQKHWALFRTMPSEVFVQFISALETREFQAGEHIVKQGEPGQEMFLISQGEVAVIREADGQSQELAKLGEGDFFGEAALLTKAPRNATVKTLSPVICLVLDKTQLLSLAKSHPPVIESIKSIYNKRLAQNASRRQAGRKDD